MENVKTNLFSSNPDFIKKCIALTDKNEQERFEFLMEAKMTGFNITDPYQLFIYDNTKMDENLKKTVFTDILYDLRNFDSDAFGADLENCAVFFFHPSKTSAKQRSENNDMHEAVKRASQILEQYGIKLFISQRVEYPNMTKTVFSEITSCMEISSLLKNIELSSPVFYHDTAPMLIIHKLLVDKTLCQNYINSVLMEPIKDETPLRQKEIRQYLRIYLKNNGKIKNIAEYTHSHTNTVLYRVQYIESAYGCNLKNYNTRWSFQLALMLHDVIKQTQ